MNAEHNNTKLTNRDLWKVFLHQLTIRGANNYERQQNAGFTEAMMPVIEKYHDDPDEKKEAYARHMEYFSPTILHRQYPWVLPPRWRSGTQRRGTLMPIPSML